MSGQTWFELGLLPLGLGLLGFIEPCSIGTSLLFLQYLEGRAVRSQVFETLAFTATRAAVIGMLGVVAVLLGSLFVAFQKTAWAVMGGIYIVLGLAYLTGHVDRMKRTFGASLGRLSGAKGAGVLGLIFAFNIPACAGPLLIALLGSAAVTSGSNIARGFVMLSLFGLALSLPIAVAVLSRHGRQMLERIGRLSARVPKIIGVLFILLGAWSIRFALVARVL